MTNIVDYFPAEINFLIFSFLQDRISLLKEVHSSWREVIESLFRTSIKKINIIKESWTLTQYFLRQRSCNTQQIQLLLLTHKEFLPIENNLQLIFNNPKTLLTMNFLVEIAKLGRLDFLKKFPFLDQLFNPSHCFDRDDMQYYFLFCCQHTEIVQWYHDNCQQKSPIAYYPKAYAHVTYLDTPNTDASVLSFIKYGFPSMKVPSINLNEQQIRHCLQYIQPFSHFELFKLYIESDKSGFLKAIQNKDHLAFYQHFKDFPIPVDGELTYIKVLIKLVIRKQFLEGYNFLWEKIECLRKSMLSRVSGHQEHPFFFNIVEYFSSVDIDFDGKFDGDLDYDFFERYLSNPLEKWGTDKKFCITYLIQALLKKPNLDPVWFKKLFFNQPHFQNELGSITYHECHYSNLWLLLEILSCEKHNSYLNLSKFVHRHNIQSPRILSFLFNCYHSFEHEPTIGTYWYLVSRKEIPLPELDQDSSVLWQLFDSFCQDVKVCIFVDQFYGYINSRSYPIYGSFVIDAMTKLHPSLKIFINPISMIKTISKYKPKFSICRKFLEFLFQDDSFDLYDKQTLFFGEKLWLHLYETSMSSRTNLDECINFLIFIRYPCTMYETMSALCEMLINIDKLYIFHDYIVSFPQNLDKNGAGQCSWCQYYSRQKDRQFKFQFSDTCVSDFPEQLFCCSQKL